MSKTTSIQDLPGPAASSAPQPTVSVSAPAPASSAAATAPSVPTAATSFPPQQPPAPGQNVVMTVTPISQAPASAPTQPAPQAPPQQQAPATSYQPSVPATTPQEQQQQEQHRDQHRMNAFMAGIQGAPSQPPQFPAPQPAQRPPATASASSPAPSGAEGSLATLRERKQAADALNGVLSLRHVLLVAVAIMFSHTPIVTKVLYRSAPSMFSSRGTYNISGLLITSIGFSLLYYGGVQLMHFLEDE